MRSRRGGFSGNSLVSETYGENEGKGCSIDWGGGMKEDIKHILRPLFLELLLQKIRLSCSFLSSLRAALVEVQRRGESMLRSAFLMRLRHVLVIY
jgi:hypothetical protein